jgi:hypothetical protein
MMRIRCPSCGRDGVVPPDDADAGNDNEDAVTLLPPEGFRKIAHWGRDRVLYFYCLDCGVAAEKDGAPADSDKQ